MAWGVRELSKRLGKIRLKLKVRTVFLLTKAHDETLIGNTREVAKWLLSPDRDVRYTVYVEENLRENKKFDAPGLIEEIDNASTEAGELNGYAKSGGKRLRYWSNSMCRIKPHNFDFVITLGGDGTVLYASWLFQRVVPPVLSFALGSLGFLTKFDYDKFEDTLSSAFKDGVTISLRLRFEGTVMRSQKKMRRVTDADGKESEEVDEESSQQRDLVEELVGEEKEDERTHRPNGTYEILNDIVVDRGPNPTMSSTEIFGDDEHFTSVQADGICVATPTGSTAYNLAAGGSLCHPENPVILITAICAHTLSFRPIILPDTIVLRVGVPYDARASSWASFDGRERVELTPGDYVTISASRYPFANVMPQGRRSEDWVNSISGKLGWNTRQRQKSYKEWQA
ncbi:ATP-NAD kinase [Phlyctema vagabunda]|uniref:ATP-NAD kinase n=1 Tax=Phlyctema vagabunda TaxID=108571 RepID=A0ABR4PJ55_9HELO